MKRGGKGRSRRKDENRTAVMIIVWSLVCCLGFCINNAVGWTVVLAVSLMCVMYIRYDIERERKEKVREKVKEMFREEMKGEQE